MLRVVRKLLNRAGLDVVRVSTFHRDIGEHLANVISRKSIDAVIDVGANAGQYAEDLRRNGFEGKIYSFEPVAAVFEALEDKASLDPNWHCFRLALGANSGEKTLNVYASDVFSSFLNANEYSKNIWKSLENIVPETVSVARLDEVFESLPNIHDCKRIMLKMDTQGFDRQVFEGSSGILHGVRVLQSELAMIPIYDGMPDPIETLAIYRDAGFHVSGMYPINRDVSGAVIEFDCVMVRRDK